MRILLTAFEPFDGTGLNSSLEGCRWFVERWGREFDLRFRILPVEYGGDTAAVEEALAECPADLLLHTGQATGASEIRVERVAVNVRYAGVERGRLAPQSLIEAEGPAGLFSTLPVEEVAAAIRGAEIPAVVSNHAGIYLCNHVLYQSLHRVRKGRGDRGIGFLHVPCLPEQSQSASPCMPVEAIGNAVLAAVTVLQNPFRPISFEGTGESAAGSSSQRNAQSA